MKIFTILILFFVIYTSKAQEIKKIQINELMPECVKSEFIKLRSKTVMWLPPEFTEAYITQVKLPEGALDKIINLMNEHLIYLVVDAKTEVNQLIPQTTFKTDEQIRKDIILIDSSNNSVLPLKENELSKDMTDFLNGMKPSLAKLLGEMGKGMNIYVFKNKLIKGERSLNIRTKNKFTISFDSTKFTWNLPLACTFPDSFCPVDKDKMKGNWNYCPIHGVSLTNK